MFQLIIRLLCIIMILLGVILIFDARSITKQFFSFGDQNEGSSGLKRLGFIVVMVSGIILMCFEKFA